MRAFPSIAATRDEKVRAMPADRLVADPMSSITHAITIDAPPERIWPWLAQLGAGRGGWYSWDRIDNGGRPSADRVCEEYQHIAPGDVLPAVPGATDAFVVTTVEPPRDLVLTVQGPDGPLMSWEHLVEPLDGGRSRLIIRARVARTWKEQAPAGPPAQRRTFVDRAFALLTRYTSGPMAALGALGHRIMEARHMRGIKRRAEAPGSGVR